MSELKIITNNHWRPFKSRDEVPEKILQSDFDWQDDNLDAYEDGFIYYRGKWYHLDDFLRIDNNAPFPSNWHSYCSDSFFSGVLIEMSDDGEYYKIATYIS